MKLSMLKESAQDSIMNHSEAYSFASKFDSVEYDATNGTSFTVLGYNYDGNGALEYVESMSFTY